MKYKLMFNHDEASNSVLISLLNIGWRINLVEFADGYTWFHLEKLTNN